MIEGSPIFHTVSNESKGEEKTVSERMVEDHKIHYFAGE